MSSSTQVKRAVRPTVLANSSTSRGKVDASNSTTPRPRVVHRVHQGKAGRRKIGG